MEIAIYDHRDPWNWDANGLSSFPVTEEDRLYYGDYRRLRLEESYIAEMIRGRCQVHPVWTGLDCAVSHVQSDVFRQRLPIPHLQIAQYRGRRLPSSEVDFSKGQTPAVRDGFRSRVPCKGCGIDAMCLEHRGGGHSVGPSWTRQSREGPAFRKAGFPPRAGVALHDEGGRIEAHKSDSHQLEVGCPR